MNLEQFLGYIKEQFTVDPWMIPLLRWAMLPFIVLFPGFAHYVLSLNDSYIDSFTIRYLIAGVWLLIYLLTFLNKFVWDNFYLILFPWIIIPNVWSAWIVHINDYDHMYMIWFHLLYTSIGFLLYKKLDLTIYVLYTLLTVTVLAAPSLLSNAYLGFYVFAFYISSFLFYVAFEVRDYSAKMLSKMNFELETQVEIKTAIIKEKMEALKLKNKELERFTFVVSHDLKRPLRTISNYSTLLAKRINSASPKELDEYSQFIVEGVKYSNQLIEDLFNYSKYHIDKMDFEPVETRELYEECIKKHFDKTITDGSKLLGQNLEHTIVASRNQILRLFQNIISNALKYNKRVDKLVIVRLEKIENYWKFSFIDNGIGIDTEDKTIIFELFTRLHSEKEYEGTGIGLSLCRKIVENHKGHIWYEPNEYNGTTFFVTISDHLGSTTNNENSFIIAHQG